MKQAILMTMLAVSLTIGPAGAYAFPSTPVRDKAATFSSGQLFWLLLPTLLTPLGSPIVAGRALLGARAARCSSP